MTDDDAVRAELEFLRVRALEILQEKRAAEAAFGEPITDDNIGGIVAGVLDALRQSGNDALAGRYASAFDRFEAAHAVSQRAILAGVVDEAALEQMNDAVEDYERVEAEVLAFLDEKGGA